MTSRPCPPEVDTPVDHRYDDPGEVSATVREFMLENPKTLPPDASIAQACAVLDNDHVHMVLLTDGSRLVGTLTRDDLPPGETSGPALALSTLENRTVAPEMSKAAAQSLLLELGIRRLAVVDKSGELLGLLCLKRRKTGFCSDTDVADRAQGRSSA